jgi:hypothetical protein
MVGAASDIDGDGTNGEVALAKPSLGGVNPTQPGNVKIAFPGTLGSCLSGSATVYGSPCTITGPDVF